LEGGTKDEIRISKEALFKGVSTRFGLRIVEKSVENLDFILPTSSFGERKLSDAQAALVAIVKGQTSRSRSCSHVANKILISTVIEL
jgi:hypothetical protein